MDDQIEELFQICHKLGVRIEKLQKENEALTNKVDALECKMYGGESEDD